MDLLEALLTLVTQQIAWQLDAYTSLETKAIGLLAFDGALGAFMAVIHPLPLVFRIVFLGFLIVSVGACVASLAIRKVYVGPQVGVFYEITRRNSNETSLLTLLSTLHDDYLRNNGPLARKGLYWTVAGYALVGAVVILGLQSVI